VHIILKIFGAIIVLFGVAVGGFALFGASTQPRALDGMMFTIVVAWTFGSAVVGALFWCFGAIVEHLMAIRENSNRQVAILDYLARGRPAQ